MLNDSTLAVETRYGLVIITGCSHSDICNVIEYAKAVTGGYRINSIIGGFRLLEADEKVLNLTTQYFSSLFANTLYPSHCTDLVAKISLSRYVEIKGGWLEFLGK